MNSHTDGACFLQHLHLFGKGQIAIGDSRPALLQWGDIDLDHVGNIQRSSPQLHTVSEHLQFPSQIHPLGGTDILHGHSKFGGFVEIDFKEIDMQ